MDNKDWRERWLNSINELTSIGLQFTSWTNIRLDNPHWSYIEFSSCYFDDLSISEDYEDEIKIGLVNKSEFEIISDWHGRLLQYNPPNGDYYDNYSVLNDPKWIEIVEIGKQAKLILAEILISEERDILLENKNVV